MIPMLNIGAAGGIPIDPDLISVWDMQEASNATRVDQVSGYNAADVNGVPQAAGQGNLAFSASMNGTNESLSVTSVAALNPGNTPFSFCGWIRFGTTKTQLLISKTSGTTGYYMFMDFGSNVISFVIYNGVACQLNTGAGTNGWGNSWRFFSLGYTTVGPTQHLRIINVSGSEDATYDIPCTVAGPAATAAALVFGEFNGAGLNCEGRYMGWRYYKGRILTIAQENAIWNAGAGILYPP